MADVKNESELIPHEIIENRIYYIRDQKVMRDKDLAELYQVETRALIQAVSRNIERFPSDFMFRLNIQEVAALRSQNVISKSKGGRRYLPYVFTELWKYFHNSVYVNTKIM